MTYLASQSARQCGPCVFGLSAMAGATQRLAAQSPQPGDLDRIVRWSGQVTGRGACHHPDGAAALMHSALQVRSEEHTSELQSQSNLVCRLLLEKKNIHRLRSGRLGSEMY